MPADDSDSCAKPDRATIATIANDSGFDLNDSEVERYTNDVRDTVATLSDLNDLEAPTPPQLVPQDTKRDPGYRPDETEDPYNVWITKGRVEGAESGPLAGLELGLKDCIALAGYELTLGSAMFEGFVPEIDATVVTRLLDAGATITGKLNMESFASSGSGELSDFGVVRNPHSKAHIAGGSSGGSGAAPALGEVDAAIGGDQGGSVRIPSSWCGTVGLKPTTGLVPYTGAVPVNITFDTLGVHAETVETVAGVLEVIAGEDLHDGVQLDPRQPRGVTAADYTRALEQEIEGMQLGVLTEGFDQAWNDSAVDATVRGSIEIFESLGATCEETSIPYHTHAMTILSAVAIQGETNLINDDLVGTNHGGWNWRAMAEAFRARRTANADRFPLTIKSTLVAGEYLRRTSNLDVYTKGWNLAKELERQVTARLDEYDVLLLPTTPNLPLEYSPELSREELADRAHGMAYNTATFSLTHHPAVSVPCGTHDGLPVGLMIVGDQFDEETVLRVASAFERAVEWRQR